MIINDDGAILRPAGHDVLQLVVREEVGSGDTRVLVLLSRPKIKQCWWVWVFEARFEIGWQNLSGHFAIVTFDDVINGFAHGNVLISLTDAPESLVRSESA